jgi:hypothetical protein
MDTPIDTPKEEKTVSWREDIETTAHVAIACGFIATAVALYFNISAVNQQSDTLQMKIFEEVNHARLDLMETTPREGDNEAWVLWEKRLVGIDESFAFIANHEYLRAEIVDYFAPSVVSNLDIIKEDYPSVLKMFRPPFGSELMKFYKNQTGKDLIHAKNTRPK